MAADGGRLRSASSVVSSVDRAARFLTAATWVAILFGLVGSLHWTLDLFAHQQRAYAAVLVLTATTLVFVRNRWWSVVALVGLAVCCLRLAPFYFGDAEPPMAGASELSIVSINVNAANRDHDAVASYLRSTQADVVAVIETSPRWIEALEPQLPAYRYVVGEPRTDTFGIALFVRNELAPGVRFDSAEIVGVGQTAARLPAIEAVVTLDDDPITILVIHPPPPITAAGARDQRDVLAAAAARSSFMSSQGTAHVVVGDLNTTPWSAAYRTLLRGSLLADSMRGNGFDASWPVGIVSSIGLGIPIDHALHSPELTTVTRELGPDVGSDHRPLHVKLTWAEEST